MTSSTTDSRILSAVLKAAVDAVIVFDDAGRILRANEAAERMFGYAEGELTGLMVDTLIPQWAVRQRDGQTSDDPAHETGQAADGRRVEGRRKDDAFFPVHLSVSETSVAGAPLYVANLHDLSRRVAGENALARSTRLDAVGQMTGGITHDFNNLLTVIIGNLELAKARARDDTLTRFLDNAMEAAESGAALTSRLLIFARKGTLQPSVQDIGELCHRTVALLRRTLGNAFRITTQCPENLSPVRVDPVQLESALVNLAVNARDAMPGGGHLLFQVEEIKIDDSYMAQETDVAPGQYVRLMVSDDGEGMTAEAQKRAFEPFFTTKASQNGTGLGLAMVYGFVRQSGGHITLYSEVGHGTSFGLYFPALHRNDTKQTGEAPAAQTEALAMGRGERVLVVEDNPKVRQISADRLQSLNYEVLQAESGDAAWRMLEDGLKVDLVFSDIVMPGDLSGYDLGARILETFPGIGVLLTSGYASDVVTSKMASSEKFEILHKPYHQLELARRLSALLGTSLD